jgi:tripartite-type tricarboxylate transporter receptor subunit TctC
MRRTVTRGLVALIGSLALLTASSGANAAPFYEGKTLTIVVGYSPGGGYDKVARLLAKHMPKYLPGKPTVIVENMPGAGSLIAANYLYNKAEPDGLTIGTFNRGLPFAQLLKEEGARFDMKKYAWLGSAATEGTVLVIRSDLPYKTFAELLKAKEPLIIGATGPTDTTTQYPRMLQEVFGLKIKIINYQSSSDIMLAIERKEVDARAGSYTSVKPFIDRGVVRAVVRGRVSEEGDEGLPVDEDLAKDARGKALLATRTAPDQVGRPFVAPPGTPAETLKILRDAFAKTIQDPELKADAKKVNMSLDFTGADQVAKVLDSVFAQPPEIVSIFAKLAK